MGIIGLMLYTSPKEKCWRGGLLTPRVWKHCGDVTLENKVVFRDASEPARIQL